MIRIPLVLACNWLSAVCRVFLPTANRQLLTYPSLYIKIAEVPKNHNIKFKFFISFIVDRPRR